MKKNVPLISAMVLATILLSTASCEREEKIPSPINEGAGVSDPNYFLSTSEVSEIDFAGIIYKFQYGNNNMMEQVEESFSFELEEDDVVITVDLASNHDLIYTNKRLSSIEVETEITYSIIEDGEEVILDRENGSYTVAVQYDSKNSLSSLTETHPEDYVLKIMREYNAANKLIKESQRENDEEIQYQTLQWDGNNVVNDKLFSQEDSSNERKKHVNAALKRKQAFFKTQRNATFTNTVTDENSYADFDNKNNPLNVLSLFGFSNGFFISANNPRRVNFSSSEEEGSAVIAHTYDNKGRIEKYTMTDPIEGPVTINLTYKN